MFSFSLGLTLGVLAGWYLISKPVWMDNLVNKIVEKVSGLIKK
jgi:hypothetical protein